MSHRSADTSTWPAHTTRALPLSSADHTSSTEASNAGDAAMAGDYAGYDGPCPPWNDSIIHHYHFSVFALDVERLDLEGSFGGAQVREAMRGHVLASGSVVGTYTLNPRLR